MTIEEQLRQIALVREQIKVALAQYDTSQTAFQATPEYIQFRAEKSRVDALMAEEAVLIDAVREDALLISAASDYVDRNPAQGVTVKKFTKLTIQDEKAAKQWAATNAPLTLRINDGELKKIVAGGVEVDWGEIVDEYKAQVSSDLSGYLLDA